jgi:hypothetical protein
MAALAKVLAPAFPATAPGVDILKTVALFCGACLFVALLMATYGLDLSTGFFLVQVTFQDRGVTHANVAPEGPVRDVRILCCIARPRRTTSPRGALSHSGVALRHRPAL